MHLTPTSFVNLSLFICKIFVGGNFRVAHILYHPDALDDRLVSELHATCSAEIPMIFVNYSATEIGRCTNVGLCEHPKSERNDHILQLIFLTQKQILHSFYRVKPLLTFQRFFIYSTNKGPDFDQKVYDKLISVTVPLSKSMLLAHNHLRDTFRLYALVPSLSDNIKAMDVKNTKEIPQKDLFNNVFGDLQFKPRLSVTYFENIVCYTHHQKEFSKREQVFANFYYEQMQMSFIDVASVKCKSQASGLNHKFIQHIQKPSYSEFHDDQRMLGDEKMYEQIFIIV